MERFAQLLASGKNQSVSYAEAGYKPHGSNAAALAKKQPIVARVAEILSQRERTGARIIARTVERVSIDKAWIIDRLRENAERALQARPVLDHEGRKIGEYRYDGAVANRALELLGKELGMFISRGELQVRHDYSNMTHEQRMRWAYGVLAQARAVLDAPDENESPLIEGEVGGAVSGSG